VKKPEWMTEATWKAIRTAWQTFMGVLCLAFITVAQVYAQGGIWDWSFLWRQGVVLGVSAVAAWWMNRPKKGVDVAKRIGSYGGTD